MQGVAEPNAGLATTPIFFLLKDEMRLSAADTATFLALVGFAWNVKPLYGLVSDLVPLLGYRRRSYLLVTTAMAALGWLALGLLPAYPWGVTLAILGLTGLGLAFTDVLCDAVMVEEGKARSLTGRFQSIQWAAVYGASVLAGVGGCGRASGPGRSGGPRSSSSCGTSARRSACRSNTTWWTPSGSPRSSSAC